MTDKETLISLRRRYGENEVIQSLFKELSNSDVENGKLKSYIHELEDKLEKVDKKKQRIKKLKAEVEVLRKANSVLISKQLING